MTSSSLSVSSGTQIQSTSHYSSLDASSYADMYAALGGDSTESLSFPSMNTQHSHAYPASRQAKPPTYGVARSGSTTIGGLNRPAGSIQSDILTTRTGINSRNVVATNRPSHTSNSRNHESGTSTTSTSMIFSGTRLRSEEKSSLASATASRLSMPLLSSHPVTTITRSGQVKALLKIGDHSHDRSVMALSVAHLGDTKSVSTETPYPNCHANPTFRRNYDQTTPICVTASADHSLHVYDISTGIVLCLSYLLSLYHFSCFCSLAQINQTTSTLSSPTLFLTT